MSKKLDIPTPGKAAAEVARLYAHGGTPSPEHELNARRSLATARLDRELRTMQSAGITLDPARAAHIVGLLLSTSGVNYDAATVIEGIVRSAIEAPQVVGEQE